MNKMLELKNEVTETKRQIFERGNTQKTGFNMENLRFQFPPLNEQNFFIVKRIARSLNIVCKIIQKYL